MKKFILSSSIIVAFVLHCVAQNTTSLQQTYESSNNEYYWKNKRPNNAYWQQDVHYKMRLQLDVKTDILSGQEDIVYVNNSPDTLKCLYFRLVQNAFQPGSYFDKLTQENKNPYTFGHYQSKGLGTVVESISINGTVQRTSLDYTILRVDLDAPILPGKQIQLSVVFKTYFDIEAPWGRMEVFEWYGVKHYNGGHFYPRLAVYDYRSGWDTDQHLGHEFYGDFGTYDVELKIASNYIVDATGTLVNQDEVMPADLRKKLDISNFKDKPLNSAPSVIIPYDSTAYKTWKFQAINVHDFAFLADPSFRIGEADWNGVKCVALVSEPHAARWQDAAQIAADIIQLYSTDFGEYAYPKIIVSDAQSGMEYPMLTMDGELSPDYLYLFAHEIGHNWFFGMLGNNETYQSAMDEGFTQFMTVWALERLQQKYPMESPDRSKFFQKNTQRFPVRYEAGYQRYLQNALKTPGVTLNTHSDMFLTTQSYGSEFRQTYNKTAVMLFNLQYVLGDEVFQNVMKKYFKQWSFCHPYLDDFRLSMNHFSGTNLNWFFDQWLETNKTIDYSIRSVKRRNEKDTYKLNFHRRGLMQMPVDFQVVDKNDSTYSFIIPNSIYVKPTTATVLPRWVGWNKYNRNYTAIIKVPNGIRNVIIDSSKRLADLNLYNNSKRRPITANFDYMFEQNADWTRYEFYGRPDIWYNGYDGLKVGFHLDGGYMKYQHCFEMAAWINTRLLQQSIVESRYPTSYNHFSFRMAYQTPMKWLSQKTWFKFQARSLDGVNLFSLGVEKRNNSERRMIGFGVKSMFLFGERSLTYLLNPDEWSYLKPNGHTNYNTSVYAKYIEEYGKRGSNGQLEVLLKSSAFGNGYNYASLGVTQIHHQKLWRFVLHSRVFVQYTIGEAMPNESALYLAGANPEELIENKFTRSFGYFPQSWAGFGTTTNHFQAGGGLNLRGYAGYLVAHRFSDGTVIPVYKGNSGMAINADLDLDGLIPLHPRFTREWLHLNIYLFGDAGVINTNPLNEELSLAQIRADAGVGTALTIKKWGRFDKIKPFTLRFDMPLFLNRPPADDPEYFKFRWILGVSRAF